MFVGKVKAFIKSHLKRGRLAYVRKFHGFDAEVLKVALRDLGLAEGDTVLVHSAFDAFQGFAGKASDILAVLDSLVGPAGTVMMPSMPFGGTAIDFARSGKVTDIRRTPSQMGLLSELFRRQRGTSRSLHPTHPVLARGARAESLTTGHEQARSPCGAGSPFAKLLECRGKILFLGTSVDTMTFFHFLEEEFEDMFSTSPLTDEVYEIPLRDGERELCISTRLFNPELSRRRRIDKLLTELRRRDAAQEAKVGIVPLLLVSAANARDGFKAILDRGETFYDA